MYNVMTIDLEEWFHANILDQVKIDRDLPSSARLTKNTETLLTLFEKHHVLATFFVVGWVAEKYPQLVQQIHQSGHEIASHSYAHRLVYELTEQQFEEDLQKSILAIEKAIGEIPSGYRAPSWSVKKETPWFFDVLKRNNIIYDASVFPVNNFLYGIPDAPRFPFSANGVLPVFPTTTYRILGQNIPFSGGFYFRLMPYALVKKLTKRLNDQGQPVIFYFHPREIDEGEPKVSSLNIRDAFIHYYGVKYCLRRLEQLLLDFKFHRVIDHFSEGNMSSLHTCYLNRVDDEG